MLGSPEGWSVAQATRSMTPGHAMMTPLLCSSQKLLCPDLDTDVQEGEVIPQSGRLGGEA